MCRQSLLLLRQLRKSHKSQLLSLTNTVDLRSTSPFCRTPRGQTGTAGSGSRSRGKTRAAGDRRRPPLLHMASPRPPRGLPAPTIFTFHGTVNARDLPPPRERQSQVDSPLADALCYVRWNDINTGMIIRIVHDHTNCT